MDDVQFQLSIKLKYINIIRMEVPCLRKVSSHRLFETTSAKKIKRIFHIKSLPTYQPDSRKNSTSKIDTLIKLEPEIKIKRFKTQHLLKPPVFGAVKTARERNAEWTKKKQLPSHHNSKSLSKSTNFKSPTDKEGSRKNLKSGKMKQKKSTKKLYSSILKRVREVVEEYQLKIEKCVQEKEVILRENERLRSQMEHMNRRGKRSEK